MGKQRVQIYGEEDQLEWTENFFKEHKVATVIGYEGSRFYSFEGSPDEASARSFVIKASYLIRI